MIGMRRAVCAPRRASFGLENNIALTREVTMAQRRNIGLSYFVRDGLESKDRKSGYQTFPFLSTSSLRRSL